MNLTNKLNWSEAMNRTVKLTSFMTDTINRYESPIEFALVETLNGNYILKPMSKVRDSDSIEQEFYGTRKEVLKESRKHLNELKREGLI